MVKKIIMAMCIASLGLVNVEGMEKEHSEDKTTKNMKEYAQPGNRDGTSLNGVKMKKEEQGYDRDPLADTFKGEAEAWLRDRTDIAAYYNRVVDGIKALSDSSDIPADYRPKCMMHRTQFRTLPGQKEAGAAQQTYVASLEIESKREDEWESRMNTDASSDYQIKEHRIDEHVNSWILSTLDGQNLIFSMIGTTDRDILKTLLVSETRNDKVEQCHDAAIMLKAETDCDEISGKQTTSFVVSLFGRNRMGRLLRVQEFSTRINGEYAYTLPDY